MLRIIKSSCWSFETSCTNTTTVLRKKDMKVAQERYESCARKIWKLRKKDMKVAQERYESCARKILQILIWQNHLEPRVNILKDQAILY